jgi:mannose/fructose/N-acetylgalactosamine-specific phosphotransferase system component IIC
VSLEVQLVLLLWGTLVGLDLVSVPQMMIARPLVAGAVAGLIVGDFETGARLGLLFELFQFDVLPVGAARYPEYGPATVAAVSAGHLVTSAGGLAFGAMVGLPVAMIGGLSLVGLRRLNARAVRAAAAQIEGGDPRVIVRVHVGGIARDAVRAALVTAIGLVLAWVGRITLETALTPRGYLALAAAAAGAGLAAAATGTLRLVGRGSGLRWFAVGLGGGALALWLR